MGDFQGVVLRKNRAYNVQYILINVGVKVLTQKIALKWRTAVLCGIHLFSALVTSPFRLLVTVLLNVSLLVGWGGGGVNRVFPKEGHSANIDRIVLVEYY